MMIFMVPAIEELYADFGGAELPLITRLMVDTGRFVSTPLGLISIVGSIAMLVIGYRYYSSTKSGRNFLDKIFLKVPVFGALNTKIQLTQLARLTSMLLTSGIPIVDALNIVGESLTNVHFRNALEFASREVGKGIPLAVPLSKSKYVPIILSQMIATGEETGKLDEVLLSLATYYENEVNEITANLTKLMEPIILLVVGGLVGILAIAIYLPIYQIGEFVQ
ncbi:MAG TPA: type II secretion system F family protein [bacterium]|nr:type II secretion system F family protein [bacterium]